MAKKDGLKKSEKQEDWTIAEVRKEKVPCNRSSFGKMVIGQYLDGHTDADGVDVEAIVADMRAYHSANPVKVERSIAKLEAKLAALKEAKKAMKA
jgi:hypothetical protein